MIQPIVPSDVRDVAFTNVNWNSKVIHTAIRIALDNKQYFCPNNNKENY